MQKGDRRQKWQRILGGIGQRKGLVAVNPDFQDNNVTPRHRSPHYSCLNTEGEELCMSNAWVQPQL